MVFSWITRGDWPPDFTNTCANPKTPCFRKTLKIKLLSYRAWSCNPIYLSITCPFARAMPALIIPINS